MKQMSLSESGFERKTKRTRKREFLDEMNLVVPWAELVALIAPHAPARGTQGGRPPFPVQTMLRIHFLHVWTRRLLQAPFGDVQRSAHMYTAC
jgi:IS5 family transposase